MSYSPDYKAPNEIRDLAPKLSDVDDECLEDLIGAQYALKMAENELTVISQIEGLPNINDVEALLKESHRAMIHLHNARRLANQLTGRILGVTL